MLPMFSEGQRVIGITFGKLKNRDVVVCRDPRSRKLILKRIVNIKNKRYFVQGDNKAESTDSRIFGWLDREDILAKVIYPKTV